MSEKLIGEVIREVAYTTVKDELKGFGPRFMERVKEFFLQESSLKGEALKSIFVAEENISLLWGSLGYRAPFLAKLLGFELRKYDLKDKKQQEDIEYDSEGREGYSITIPPYIEWEKKTPAQEMWEQLVKEYQEQVKEDENEAEQACKYVLEKLGKEEYSVCVDYSNNKIEVGVFVSYNTFSSYTFAWKQKVKSIMSRNGFNPETYTISYETNMWKICYKISE